MTGQHSKKKTLFHTVKDGNTLDEKYSIDLSAFADSDDEDANHGSIKADDEDLDIPAHIQEKMQQTLAMAQKVSEFARERDARAHQLENQLDQVKDIEADNVRNKILGRSDSGGGRELPYAEEAVQKAVMKFHSPHPLSSLFLSMFSHVHFTHPQNASKNKTQSIGPRIP